MQSSPFQKQQLISDLKGDHRNGGVVGDVFPDASHKEMGDPFAPMGWDAHQIGMVTFTVIQHAAFYAIIAVLVYLKSRIGKILEL